MNLKNTILKKLKRALFLAVIAAAVCIPQGLVSAAELSDRDNPEIQRVEPFQVFDNLYYVGAKWVSAWLYVTDQGLILIDSLYGDLTDLAIENIRTLGFDPNDISYLIVTHAHYDHVGGARRFQDEFGAVVMMTETDWQMTTEPAIIKNTQRLFVTWPLMMEAPLPWAENNFSFLKPQAIPPECCLLRSRFMTMVIQGRHSCLAE
jgi:glyoxylase-like metal-dependent hydrolase (beta-lactamase superfamily II)